MRRICKTDEIKEIDEIKENKKNSKKKTKKKNKKTIVPTIVLFEQITSLFYQKETKNDRVVAL